MEPVPAAPEGATIGPQTDQGLVPEHEPIPEPTVDGEPATPALEPADDQYVPI